MLFVSIRFALPAINEKEFEYIPAFGQVNVIFSKPRCLEFLRKSNQPFLAKISDPAAQDPALYVALCSIAL